MALSRMSEREVTFDVPDDWAVPDLTSVVPDGGALESATHDLVATYYDTRTSALRRLGITLRRREGGSDAGWHLKVPTGTARTEIHSQAAGSAVPDSLTTRVSGVTGGLPVVKVATILTTRRVTRVLGVRHRLVAEVADDVVTGTRIEDTGQESTIIQWREVEVELGAAGTEEDLTSIGDLLTQHGARPAAVGRKIDHVLGAPHPRDHDGVTGALSAYLEAQCAAVLLGDVRCRDDALPEAVHDFRVAIRRLRSAIRTMSAAIDRDAEALTGFDKDLRWLAGLLSPVRDGDVLGQLVRLELEALPPGDVVGPVRDEIRRLLTTDRKDALERWQEGWRDDRYRRVMATCGDWYASPPVPKAGPSEPSEGVPTADETAKKALAKATRALNSRLSAAQDEHDLHQARKSAKRLRYVADLLSGEQKHARRRAKHAKRVQRVLGEHQDLVVTGEFFRRMARSQVHNGFTYGLLAGRVDLRASRIRAELHAGR